MCRCFSAFQLLVGWPREKFSILACYNCSKIFREWIFLTKELIRCKSAHRRMWLKMQWMPLQHLNQAVRFINTAAHSKPCSKTSVLASAELGWECRGTEGPLACPWSCTRDESQIYHQPFSVHGIPLFSGLRPLLEARRCSKDCRLITEL